MDKKKKKNMFIDWFLQPAMFKHMVRRPSGTMEFHDFAAFIRTAVARSSETPGAGRGPAIAQLYGLYAGD